MRKLLTVLFFLIAIPCFGQTAITGTVQDISANPLQNTNSSPSGTWVRAVLKNYAGITPIVSGTTNFAKTVVDFFPNSSGQISGLLYGNNLISPPGTYYTIQIFFNGLIQSSQDYCNIQGATWNLNTATPCTTTPPPFSALLGAQTFTCAVAPASTTWTCTHNFGNSNVIVECYDSFSHLIWPDTIVQTNNNVTTITWVNPTTGTCTIMDAGQIAFTNIPNAIVANPTANQTIGNGFNLNLTGPLNSQSTANFSIPGVFTNTQMNYNFQVDLHACNPATEYAAAHGGPPAASETEGLTACVVYPSGSTVSVATGIGSYVQNNVTNGTGLGENSQVRGLANGTLNFAHNNVVQDAVGVTGAQLIDDENDIFLFGSSQGQIVGSEVLGDFGTGSQPASAVGYLVAPPNLNGSTNKFTTGFSVADGATTGFAYIAGASATAPTNNVSSQKYVLFSRDSGGTTHEADLQEEPGGILDFLGIGTKVSTSGFFTNSQMNPVVQSLVNGCNPTTEYNAVQGNTHFSTDANLGCIVVPVSSTIWGSNAVAGYANNSSAADHVDGGYFQSRCLANGTSCWGINGVAQDVVGLTSGVILTHEFDTQPQNATTAYTSGGVQSDLYAPTSGTFPMQAYSANIGQVGKWSNGYFCNNGAVGNACFFTGANGTPTGSNGNFGSQSIDIRSTYWTGSGVGNDDFQLVTGIGGGSPPTFVNLNLTHPAGLSSANFLIANNVNFGLVNGSLNSSFIAPNSSAPNNSVFTLPAQAGTLAEVYVTVLTTTAATSDNVTVTGMTSSGHCALTSTNASAATNISTTYVSAKTTNQITVTHTATSGMTYDIMCTPN